MTSEVSIVVPVYKGVRFLREALESVKAQTFSDWECLCVDDGSRDGSGAVLDEIAADEPRIRVFHRENGGTSVARNFALAQAQGRYVAFLDEDDVYHPRMLETLHAAAEKTHADVVGCEFLKFNEDEHPRWLAEPPDASAWRIAASRAAVAEWASNYYDGIPFEVWRNLYRRTAIIGHDFPRGVRVEQDLHWQYTLLPRLESYVRIPWAGYAWRASTTGGFLHPDSESLISLTQTDRTVFRTLVDRLGLDDCQRRRVAGHMSDFLYYCLWMPLHGGISLDAAQSKRLRRGLGDLLPLGIDLTRRLGWRKRLLWRLFLLTGDVRWVGSRKSAGGGRT